MTEINIPARPLDYEPSDAIRAKWPVTDVHEASQAALELALEGIRLGDYDREVIDWLAVRAPAPKVAAICSWIARARQVGDG